MEEERRVAYVAFTRAKEKLYLTSCSRRLIYGRIVRNAKSRFLTEFLVSNDLKEIIEKQEESKKNDNEVAIQNSQNITAKNVTVLGGHDGFDVRTCDNVLVEDCTFLTGDDCIAGFDNIDVIVRNCTFESACSVLRFGGTNVLVENCHAYPPTHYGFRGKLSHEDRIEGNQSLPDPVSPEALNAFLYYCDGRAKIRRTPGSIVIRNCTFKGLKRVFRMPFGHKWCCNRSLADITFEGCTFEDVSMASASSSEEGMPLSFCIKDSTVIARKGCEEIAFAEMQDCNELILEAVSIENFNDPRVVCPKDCNVTIYNTSPLRVERAD